MARPGSFFQSFYRGFMKSLYSAYLLLITPLMLSVMGMALVLFSKHTLVAPVLLPLIGSVPIIAIVFAASLALPLLFVAFSPSIRRSLSKKVEHFMEYWFGREVDLDEELGNRVGMPAGQETDEVQDASVNRNKSPTIRFADQRGGHEAPEEHHHDANRLGVGEAPTIPRLAEV